MSTLAGSFFELLNGDAYRPHPADAALSLGRRFPGRTLVIVGGGGTGSGWTQRLIFGRDGKPTLVGRRSFLLKRGTAEWTAHLSKERNETCGWAVLLIEQQWQAALSRTSSASIGVTGVERMLRVRDAVSEFGDDKMSEDAVRAAVDHPTMEGAVVAGMRMGMLEPLERELHAAGFQLAATRIAVFAMLERYLAQLQKKGESPSRCLVSYDGQSALLLGIRDGAFDFSEGGISYLVNRSATEVRTQVAKRISSQTSLKEWGICVEVIGAPLTFEAGAVPDGIDIRQEADDVALAAVDENVRHDLRLHLQEMRLALPNWVRSANFLALAAVCAFAVGVALQFSEGIRFEDKIARQQNEHDTSARAASAAQSRVEQLKREEARARQVAEWVDRNYHAQALVHAFLSALPIDVSLDAVSFQAAEGLPQSKLKFTLLGSEDSQRAALRSIEDHLYHLGYEIGRREDPLSSNARRGGVVYAWDLIVPTFGS